MDNAITYFVKIDKEIKRLNNEVNRLLKEHQEFKEKIDKLMRR